MKQHVHETLQKNFDKHVKAFKTQTQHSSPKIDHHEAVELYILMFNALDPFQSEMKFIISLIG